MAIEREFPASPQDLQRLRDRPDIAARSQLGTKEQEQLRNRVVAALAINPLEFVDLWVKVFEDDLRSALECLIWTILPGLASLQWMKENQHKAAERDIARVCLGRMYKEMQVDALRALLLADEVGDLHALWNAIKPFVLVFNALVKLPTPDNWAKREIAHSYPSHLVGEELMADYRPERDGKRTKLIQHGLEACDVSDEVTTRLAWPLLALARRADQETKTKVYEVICMVASLSQEQKTGGVVKAQVVSLLKEELDEPALRTESAYEATGGPTIEIVPWSRYELTREESRPDAGDGYRNLTSVVMPALRDVMKRLSVDLTPYHFRVTLARAECYAPAAYGFVGESLGLPLALAAYAASQGWAELPPVAATGRVTPGGEVTGAGLLGVGEKVAWLLKYNKWLQKQPHARPIEYLYVPEGDALHEAKSTAGEALKINHKVFVDKPLRLKTLDDLLDPDVLWDPFDIYLQRIQTLFPHDDPRAGPAIWEVPPDDEHWLEDVDQYEKVAQNVMPGFPQIFPIRYLNPIEPVLGYFARHFARERIRARREHRRAPAPVLLDATQLESDMLLDAIGDSLRNARYGDPRIRPQDVQNAWVQPDGLALVFHATEEYGQLSATERQSDRPSLVRVLMAWADELERHRVIVIARNLHQMIYWARQMHHEGLLEVEPSAPQWWRTQVTS